MISHEIPRECYRCLCRACGHAGCPHRDYIYKRCENCWYSHKFRPILDCENFYFKMFKRYKVRRVRSKPIIRYVDKTNADDIRVMLTEILTLLRSGSESSPVTDVNCVKHNCLCLSCNYFPNCKERCKICRSYRGQHPVKMCALKLQRDKKL